MKSNLYRVDWDEFVSIRNEKTFRGISANDFSYSFRLATDDEILTFK